jgi:hypothetical protein
MDFKSKQINYMKYTLLAFCFLFSKIIFAQNDPVLSIDGVNTVFKSGLSLPYWVKPGQTISLVSSVQSVSILEFIEDNGNLKYSQTISLNNTQTVPSGKVWKIESFGFKEEGKGVINFSNNIIPSIMTSPVTFSTPGTYSWKVPPGVTNICIEAWGGGAGASSYGGGGGGGYGYQCFTVQQCTEFIIKVGAGGGNSTNGDSSSFGNLLTAYGGKTSTSNLLGTGGNSNANYFILGGNSTLLNPNILSYTGGTGGNGGNGGNGNSGYDQNGGSPGGGGAKTYVSSYPSYYYLYGTGASGQIKIFW